MNEYINAAMVAIQKLIAAATPIAVKAYELSLLTLQIDALGQLLPAILVCTVFPWLIWRIYKWDILEKNTDFSLRGMPTTVLGVFACGGIFVWQICVVFNVWIWVKLFKPELWLVHAAIEKVIK